MDEHAAGRPPLAMVLALGRDGALGKDGKVPWDVAEDRKHFRRTTTGHAVIMGRKTWDEVGKPLPNRRNIVVSRTPGLALEGAEVVPSLERAIELARETDNEPMVIGGAEIYRLALPHVTRIYLTEIDQHVAADTYFELDRTGFRETERRAGETPGVTFITLER